MEREGEGGEGGRRREKVTLIDDNLIDTQQCLFKARPSSFTVSNTRTRQCFHVAVRLIVTGLRMGGWVILFHLFRDKITKIGYFGFIFVSISTVLYKVRNAGN